MKRFTFYIIALTFLYGAANVSSAPMYSASVTVYDQNGQPLAGVPVRLEVHTTTMFDFDIGTTDMNGYVYLAVTADGFLDYMYVTITDQDYEILSSQGTYTETSNYLYPTFDVGLDINRNDVVDGWEMPLAQKFCPDLRLHSLDYGVSPVPVESLDRNGDGALGWEDVLVRLYDTSGGYHGEFDMDEIAIGEMNPYYMYLKYPHLAPVHKEVATPDINGNGLFGESGEATAVYLMVPHFEWGDISNTSPTEWYSSWISFIGDHHTETKYADGTTYVNFFDNGNDTIIQYWFFYVFNASANRHEGDWEHINVVLDSQDPTSASISRVEYYFHEEVAPRYTAGVDYSIVNSTHPAVFVGGHTGFIDGYDGHGTHGSFPDDGNWPNINPIGTDEDVDGFGLHIDFNNYQNIVIMPAIETVQPGDPLEWMTFAAYWGHAKSSPSAGEDLDLFAFGTALATMLPTSPWLTVISSVTTAAAAAGHHFSDDASIAPIGPAIKDSWEKVYDQSGAHVYTAR